MKKFNNEVNGKFIGVVLGMIFVIIFAVLTAYGTNNTVKVSNDTDLPVYVEVTTINTTSSVVHKTSTTVTMTYDTFTKITKVSSLLTMTSEVKTEAITTAMDAYPTQSFIMEENVSLEEEPVYYEETEAVDVGTYYIEEPVEIHEYVVYKPSTKYIHKNNCEWCDSSCYEITSTEDIEARKCEDCNPEMDIVNEYIPDIIIEPETPSDDIIDDTEIDQNSNNELTSLNYITETERIMLCNVVGGEYGSDWISQYDKACVVACVMNRYYDGGWQGYGMENTIYNIIVAPDQFDPYYANPYYNSNVTDSCISAVEYYFENQSSFPHYLSFHGDGTRNYFY